MSKKIAVVFCWFCCQFALAQIDSIQKLREVIVSDSNLKPFSKSKNLVTISDSIIKKNQPSLTSLLNYNTTIYFKENGLGMVSSPSFRGTTAQQTAVVWNGININSQLLGQTDFNTISVRDFNSISVRAGGGSTIYGSGAIGGSIHLNTDLGFRNEFSNDLFLNYGSFQTFGINNKTIISDNKTSLNISLSRNQSRNDYDYLNTDLKNENGQFENISVNIGFGYKLNSNNRIQLYSQYYGSERNLSGTLYAKSTAKYNDLNTRNLLVWNFEKNKITSSLKLAHLAEKYQYFYDFLDTKFETGAAETLLANYNFGYKITSNLQINSILEYTNAFGFGKNIGRNRQVAQVATLLLQHKLSKILMYDLSIRKESTTTFESPILFSVGLQAKANDFYTSKLAISKNYRIPTFNDLYWLGAGNRNLTPETSIQTEIIQDFRIKKTNFRITGFYNKMQNMIRWVPTNGNWSPENVTNVRIYGLESTFNFRTKINCNELKFNTSYAYTASENEATRKQLTFVPFHKFNANLDYNYKKFGVNYQLLYNGYVFTLSDNEDFLKGYQVGNFMITYNFNKKENTTIGFQILNIGNENYQSVPSRPSPGRNYSITFNFKL